MSASALMLLSQAISSAPQPANHEQAEAVTAPKEEDFPRQSWDPTVIAAGRQIFSVNCAFCHGADGRGGEGGGPNLLRSPLVLNDQQGEVIHGVLLTGRVDKGMPKFNFTPKDAAQIAAYLHSLPIGARGSAPLNPRDILVGDAVAGRKYFYGRGRCNQCHSVQGDFAHIGARLDPKTLQDNIISGGVVTKLGAPLPTAPPRIVTVTLASGEVIRGELTNIDDFDLSLVDESGHRRTVPRRGERPSVLVSNPMQAHLDMLRHWEDRDIHNLTAFLAGQR